MSNFIQRKFQNINSNEIIEFDTTVSAHEYLPLNKSNIEKLNHSIFTVILGVGGSGKTYLLKEYNRVHEKSLYIDYVNMESDYNIKEDTEIVILDSIDEEFARSDNARQSKINLISFIKRCQKINHEIKFIFSMRSVSWSYGRKLFERLTSGALSVYELDNKSTISILLGEPASGKTFQLKEYNKNNQHANFTPLSTLKETDTISEDIEVVLIDSIDEALTQNNQKTLARELTEYIQRCIDANPKVRFVISCRFLEWNKYFKNELKAIDSYLEEYGILPLSTEDMGELLVQKGIDDKEFWRFIEENYLESLLKNILVVLSIMDKFDEYKTQQVTFIDIYHDIAKEYLSKKGDDREDIASNISINKQLKIASSLAAYMTFNREPLIDSSSLPIVASELYQIDGSDIVVDDLKIVLNTALFEKKGNEFSFFHQSTQEYLTAYFLASKNLDSKTLKSLLSSNMRFYEEFEEVVVYLTNIKEDLFDDFVSFDPFIFRRHPSLTKDQQEKLLNSLLDKFQNDEVQAWGRWRSLDGTTLVRFDKLDNLVDILKRHYTGENANYYLMQLLEYNYSQEFKSFIFDVFSQKLNDKKSLRSLIKGNFIDNYDLNVDLYSFMQEEKLLSKDRHTALMTFETELFCSLYGIEYTYQYGFERTVDRTDYDFSNLLLLMDFFPSNNLQYIAPYLLLEDTLTWFEYIKSHYDKNKYSPKYIKWVIFSLLNTYEGGDVFVDIAKFLKEISIFLHHDSFEGNNAPRINFDNLSEKFWKLYFGSDFFNNSRVSQIIPMFNISPQDIKKATEKYPIKNYLKKYGYFRRPGEEIDKFLMSDKDFKKYMENIWREQKERDREYKEELQKERESKEGYIKEKAKKEKRKRIFQHAVLSCNSSKDIKNIFNYLVNNNHSLIDNLQELDEEIRNTLKDKYSYFLELVIQEWNSDMHHKTIIERLNERSIPIMPSLMYFYLFSVSSNEKIAALVYSDTEYEKLFWYAYRNTLHMDMDYFYWLTEKHFDVFVELSITLLDALLSIGEKPDILSYQAITHVAKKLGKFNAAEMHSLTNYIAKIDTAVFPKLEVYDRKNLLEILSLSKENYNFIYDLMLNEMDNCSDYLQYLLKIDTPKALNDFLVMYQKTKRYKISFGSIVYRFTKKPNYNGYDNINLQKRDFFSLLLISIKANKNIFDSIKSSHFVLILEDYYEFFADYIHPDDTYSPDNYDRMHTLIGDIWNYLGSTSSHIDMLEELSNYESKRISDRAKYALTNAYEQQEKERSYPNSYYKGIFDIKNKKESRTIVNNGIYVEGNNSGVIAQDKSSDTVNKNEKWYQEWWFFSMIAGGIAFYGILWNFDSWIIAIVGGIVSSLIVWKLNPKFRFRNIGYSLLLSWGLSSLISFSGTIIIPKNDLIHGVIKIGENHFSILLLLISIPFFILDYFENKK